MTVEGCQAGRLGHLFRYMREYIAQSPKQGSKRFNSIEKMIGFDHLVIIYLCCNRIAIQTSEALDYKIYGKAVSFSLFLFRVYRGKSIKMISLRTGGWGQFLLLKSGDAIHKKWSVLTFA